MTRWLVRLVCGRWAVVHVEGAQAERVVRDSEPMVYDAPRRAYAVAGAMNGRRVRRGAGRRG